MSDETTMDDDWPDDVVSPFEGHDPGECDECDWNRARILALFDDQPDPGPYQPEQAP